MYIDRNDLTLKKTNKQTKTKKTKKHRTTITHILNQDASE